MIVFPHRTNFKYLLNISLQTFIEFCCICKHTFYDCLSIYLQNICIDFNLHTNLNEVCISREFHYRTRLFSMFSLARSRIYSHTTKRKDIVDCGIEDIIH